MTVHQLIHTSCKKGIFDRYSGFQIYSFDKEYEPYLSKNNSGYAEMSSEVAAISAYKDPYGIFVTDMESAKEMPKAFSYRRISNGQCVIAKTVFCRDFTSTHGKFGNRFKHHIIYDVTDASWYPAEMYDSDTLRESLTPEEAASDKKPDYLPVPTLQKGSMISAESISEFLNGDAARLEIFKKMLHALLNYHTDNKKIVICDDEENIIFWIAALEYAIPLRLAVDVSFTTYSYDPSVSPFMICGVYPPKIVDRIERGTAYDPKNTQQRNIYAVFDLKNNLQPDYSDCELNSFYDFIEQQLQSDCCSAIEEFHNYFETNYPNEDLTEKISYIYCLYELYNKGISSIEYRTFKGVVEYLKSVGNDRKEILKVSDILLRDLDDFMNLEQAFLADALKILYTAYPDLSDEQKHALDNYVADRTLNSLMNKEITENDFLTEYESLEKISDPHVSIKSKLTENDGLQKIASSLSSDKFPLWKLKFINKIIFDKYQNADLALYQPGGIISNIYLTMLSSCEEPLLFAQEALSTYINASDKFLALLFTFAETLDANDTDEYYTLAAGVIGKNCYSTRDLFFNELLTRKMYSQMYLLYIAFLDNKTDIESMKTLFNEQNELYLKKDAEYNNLYFNDIISDFTSRIDKVTDSSYDNLRKTLLLISLKNNIQVSNEQIIKTAALIPLSDLSKDDAELVSCLRDYFQNPDTAMDSYVKLLFTGSILHGAENLDAIVNTVNDLYPEKKITFDGTAPKCAAQFVLWTTCDIVKHCKSEDDIAKAFSLFNFSEPYEETAYAKEFAKCCINRSVKSRDNAVLINYLEYIAKSQSEAMRDAVRSALRNRDYISQSSLNTLGNTITSKYSDRKELQEYWKEINKSTLAFSSSNRSGFLSEFFEMICSLFKKK